VRDAKTVAVDGHESIDASLQRLVDQALDAAQIAKTLFADGAHKSDRPRRRHATCIQRACDRNHGCKAATVVADAWSHEERSPCGGL
jgi:hypothetical protein